MQLDMLPRLNIIRTSKGHLGQIYIHSVNMVLGFSVVALVAIFRRSANLANAYGLAVCGAMFCDSLLLFPVFRSLWRWPVSLGAFLAACFLLLDAVFVSAALAKIPSGGWIPLCIATGCLFVLNTWMSGRLAVRASRFQDEVLKKKGGWFFFFFFLHPKKASFDSWRSCCWS